MWICEACEKLANCLWVDCVAMMPGASAPRPESPIAKAAGIERMKFHEAGPGFVEQDVIAEMSDLRDDHFGVVNGAVIGALFDDGDAERARLAPGLRILDQRMGADALTQGGFIERVPAHRADQPPGIA